MKRRRLISHIPIWQSAELPIDASGNTRPGFVCVHQLENGNGVCYGNVFDLDQAIGDHSCVVEDKMTDWATFWRLLLQLGVLCMFIAFCILVIGAVVKVVRESKRS